MSDQTHTTEFSNGSTLPALAYRGEVIHQRNQMLSLTDMWRAANSPDERRPAEWLRSADAQRFISFLGDTLNVGNSHTALTKAVRGGAAPGTWAHWQIALAYAKYLSPDFHMWCNTVVRERMEGRPTAAVPDDVLELIRRTDGIARQLSGRLAAMQAQITVLEEKNATPALDFGGTVSAYQIIELAGIAPEDRQRGTAQMVTKRLLAFCAARQVACFQTPAEVNPSKPFRFAQSMASLWLLGEARGLELIRNQVDRMKAKKAARGRKTGQASLHLVQSSAI